LIWQELPFPSRHRLSASLIFTTFLPPPPRRNLLQIPEAVIKAGIENLSYVPGRLERIDSSFGFTVLVDYAHKPDALKQVLQNLVEFKKKRIITVFGCGGNRDTGKRPLMGEAATFYSDLTIVTSDNPRLEDPLVIIAEIEKELMATK